MGLQSGSVRLALCAMLIGTATAWALTPHDKAVGVQAEHRADNAVNAQQNAGSEPQKASDTAPIIPSVHAASGDREGQPKAQEGTEEGTEFWTPLRGYRFKITDSIIAAFTVLLFVATLALWWSTRSLVKGADKTAERQLRAYVGISKVEFRNLEGTAEFWLAYRNSGQTPAYKMQSRSVVKYCEYPIDENFDREEGISGMLSTLGPDSIQHFAKTGPRQLTMPELMEIRNGTAAIYLYGVLTYEDCFGKKRFTEFRYITGGNAGINPHNSMGMCQGGNHSD